MRGGTGERVGVRRRRVHARSAEGRRGRAALHTSQRQRRVVRGGPASGVPAGRSGRLDANRGAATRVVQRARQRARARRNAWITAAVVLGVPLLVLLWPVKSLFYHIPKWYVQLLLGI